MATPLEQALPRVPAWVDNQTIANLPKPITPCARGKDVNNHSIVFDKGQKHDKFAERLLDTTSFDTIGIIPPGTPEDVVDAAIEHTKKDTYASKRNPTQRIIVATSEIAERLRTAFPNLPILDAAQLTGLIKTDRIYKDYGVELPDHDTLGMLEIGATVVDRLITARDRGRIPRFVHQYSGMEKVIPSAVKAATLLSQHPDAIFVEKSGGGSQTIFNSNDLIPIFRMLAKLDLEPSNNIVARRALLDHIPFNTAQYGDLIKLMAAAEYAQALNMPVGSVMDLLTNNGHDQSGLQNSTDFRMLKDFIGEALQQEGLDRLIDLQSYQYKQINESLPSELGKLLPGFYTLLQKGAVDLIAVRNLDRRLHNKQFPGLQRKESRSSLGMTGISKTTLPTELPPYVYGYPTLDRWETSLPGAVGSVGYAAERDGISKDSAFLIADGTPNITDKSRSEYLRRFFERDGYVPGIPIYILTQEGQLQVINEVERRTGLSKEDISAVIGGTSCGHNRQKIIVAGGSYVMDGNNQMVLGLMDDDLELHYVYPKAKRFGDIPNSQVILNTERRGNGILFELLANGSLKTDFMDIPGKTIDQLRLQNPDLPATETWSDTMHRELDNAQQAGVALFQVNPAGPPIEDDATIWGVSAIKHFKPDYRTIKVTRDYLLNEFPSTELSMASFPAGPSFPFAFQVCNTNVDLAFSAWAFNKSTAKLPYAFLISREISNENPFKTVTTNSRADNELQPGLLPIVKRKTGQSLVYVTGSPLRVEHHRESSGYRPNMIEQACTSLVDNLYAQAANEMMEFEDGFPYLPEEAIDNYRIPEGRAKGVFDQLQELASIASFKIMELSQKQTHSASEEQTLRNRLEQYRQIIESLRFKLGVQHFEEKSGKEPIPISEWDDVSFPSWKVEIDLIGNKQLHYYGRVLKNTPIITSTVHNIIQEGKYPVSVMVPNGNRYISLAGQPSVKVNR